MTDLTQMRICKNCGSKPLGEFKKYLAYTTGTGKQVFTYKCQTCEQAKAKARYVANPEASIQATLIWRQANPDAYRAIANRHYRKKSISIKAQQKTNRDDLRFECLSHYSGGEPQCELCHETHLEFLCIDHPDGGGNAHRKELNRKSTRFFQWLKQNDFPPDYRVLCHNCNFKENLRLNRETFEAKEWGFKTRTINGKQYQVSLRNLARGHQRLRDSLKIQVLTHYGSLQPVCACCVTGDLEILALDHIEGGGNEHRRALGISGGSRFYRWIMENNYPDGYRVLCHNCNFSLGAHGSCPHRPVLDPGSDHTSTEEA